MVLYNEKYNYKMTHLEILEDLLKDANIEFMSFGDQQNGANNPDPNDQNQQNQQNQQDSSSDGDGDQQQHGSGDASEDDSQQSDEMNEQSQSTTSNSGSGSNGSAESSDGSDDGLDRNSAYRDEDHDAQMLKITFNSNKNIIHFVKIPPKKENDRYDRLDNESEDVIDQIQDYIDYTVSKLKGTGMKDILSKIGCPIEVDMSWEDKIIKYVDDITNISTSHKEIATWAKMNIYTRHIATLPGRKPLPESYPTIYLMFDQSGSMSNITIRKINYIIQYFYKKKYRVNVFVHDDSQTAEDVKIYEFASYKQDEFELNQLITSRVKAGGTSHKGVFDVMAQYIEEVKTRGHKKYNSHYVLIASDLYSDIEQIYQKYEWIRLLGKNVIAITESKDMQLPFGQTIVME